MAARAVRVTRAKASISVRKMPVSRNRLPMAMMIASGQSGISPDLRPVALAKQVDTACSQSRQTMSDQEYAAPACW